MPKMLIGSANPDKVAEIRQIFALPGWQLCSRDEFEDLPDIVEDANTLEGNALKKARELCNLTGLPVLADDTGFFVRALNWQPGIYAARYAGPQCSYADNRHKLLHAMQGLQDRYAEFRTAAVIALPDQTAILAVGSVCGQVTFAEQGEGGFGYDSIFLLPEVGLTFAQMDKNAKNEHSHRGRALRLLAERWRIMAAGMQKDSLSI